MLLLVLFVVIVAIVLLKMPPGYSKWLVIPILGIGLLALTLSISTETEVSEEGLIPFPDDLEVTLLVIDRGKFHFQGEDRRFVDATKSDVSVEFQHNFEGPERVQIQRQRIHADKWWETWIIPGVLLEWYDFTRYQFYVTPTEIEYR